MSNVFNNKTIILNNDLAMDFYRSIRWAYGLYCPKCKSLNIINRGMRAQTKRYSCNDCKNNFNDFTNTVFYKSKVPMSIIFYVLVNLENKTITQISKEINYSKATVYKISKKFNESLLIKNQIENTFYY